MGLHALMAPKNGSFSKKWRPDSSADIKHITPCWLLKISSANWERERVRCATMAISVLQFDSKLEIKQASVTTLRHGSHRHRPLVNHAGDTNALFSLDRRHCLSVLLTRRWHRSGFSLLPCPTPIEKKSCPIPIAGKRKKKKKRKHPCPITVKWLQPLSHSIFFLLQFHSAP